MAAAGAAAKQGMWIARMWRMGWEKIPVIMACQCFTAPIILFFVGQIIFVGPPNEPAQKYRYRYTVVRPGDPRIERINNYSKFDKMGFFSKD